MTGQSIAIQRTLTAKPKPSEERLGFGKVFSDHMFRMDYNEEQGWHDPRIVPYGPITIDPAAKALHYGQTVFEGIKAFRTVEGRIVLFRPNRHVRRLNRSCERLSVPPLDEELLHRALIELVRVDRDWVPSAPGTSLYIRPFVIATESVLGVAPSREYAFLILLTPVGAYDADVLKPVSIHVEAEHVRAVVGGVGDAKTAGNYAASLKAQSEAARGGFHQVLWLDGVHHRYVEEVGSMNVFFRMGDKVITPALTGSFLEGVTRDSAIRLLQRWGIPVEERLIAIDEVLEAQCQGGLGEMFGTGTAAVVSPVGELGWQDQRLRIGSGEAGELACRLYEALTGIQTGRRPDEFGWLTEVVAATQQ